MRTLCGAGIGAGVAIGANLYYGNYGSSAQGFAFQLAARYLPKSIINKIPGLEGYGEQMLKQNLGLKIMGTEHFVNYLQNQSSQQETNEE